MKPDSDLIDGDSGSIIIAHEGWGGIRTHILAVILAGAFLASCSTAQLQQVQADISTGIQAACTDVTATAKLNPNSPVVAWANGACPLGIAASSLVQNSATLQWLGGLQAQLAQPVAAKPAA